MINGGRKNNYTSESCSSDTRAIPVHLSVNRAMLHIYCCRSGNKNKERANMGALYSGEN